MKDSKRLRTLKLLSQWIVQEVTIANGYKHDIAELIRGQGYITDATPLPCVSILEAPLPDRGRLVGGGNDNSGNAKANERWVLLVQGWVEEDPRYPTDAAYELMADVKKAIAKLFTQQALDDGLTIKMEGEPPLRAYYLAGLVNDIEIEPGTVRPVEHPNEKAFFWMRVILKFTERVNDPYAYT